MPRRPRPPPASATGDDSPDGVARHLRERAQVRLASMSDDEVSAYLAEAVYLERRRFHDGEGEPEEVAAIEQAARSLYGDRPACEAAILRLVDRYAREVHHQFSPRTYRLATKLLPGALTRLLTAAEPRDLVGSAFDPASRIVVRGPTDLLARLAKTHTLVLAPTHVSNLDSPLIGYALYSAGLPPFIYGAGLNLFSNPAMAFFISRLGAYTVDRRKKHRLYKDVLKDYSVMSLTRGRHSLFFPGGTRSRTGMVEKRVKKGLLGTGIQAWQEMIAAGHEHPDVLVVPCTLSYTLVLEAETLIEDSLAAEGRQRYIITDDEFSEPRTVASFARRVLSLDAAVHVRFGPPIDPIGNAVDDEGRSLAPDGTPIERRDYVCNRAGRVEPDPQRDRVYTSLLAKALVRAWHRDSVALPTHVAGYAAWHLLKQTHPRLDTYQLVLLRDTETLLPRRELLRAIGRLAQALRDRERAGRIHLALPAEADALLDEAIDRFGRFHTRAAVAPAGNSRVRVDPRLSLYYGNRLVGHGLAAKVFETDEALDGPFDPADATRERGA